MLETDGGGNGWQFDTREATNALFRPQLNVSYTIPLIIPEPGSATLLLAAVTFAVAFRGRRHQAA